MPVLKESGRLAWLNAALATQKDRVLRFLQRIGDLGLLQAMKPKMFSKFLRLIEQIAIAHEEEMRILSEIEAIERKHRMHRKQGFLKRAERHAALPYEKERREDCAWEDKKKYGSTQDDEADDNGLLAFDDLGPAPLPPRSHTLLWLLALWILMTRNGSNSRKQSLTPD